MYYSLPRKSQERRRGSASTGSAGLRGVMVFASELKMLLAVALVTVDGLCALGIGWLVWFWRSEYASLRAPRRVRALAQVTGAKQDIPARVVSVNELQPASMESLEDTLTLPAIGAGGAQLRDEGFLGQDALERLMVRYHAGQAGNGKSSGWKQN